MALAVVAGTSSGIGLATAVAVAQSDGSARAIEWSFETKAALEALAKAQSGLPHPPAAGSGVALQRKK